MNSVLKFRRATDALGREVMGTGGVQGFPKFIIYCINEEGSCLVSKLKLN